MRLKPARSVLAALGVVAVVASIAVTAAPAFASSGAVDYFLDDVNLAANGGVGKAYPIFTLEDGTLSNVKLSIDLSHLDGIATVSFPDASTHCSVTGDTATCELPDNTGHGVDGYGNVGMLPMKLTPGAGATDGVTTSISATISADGASSQTYTTPVRVIDGPDLSLASQDGNVTVRPKDSTDIPFDLTNTGSQPADGIEAVFVLTSGLIPQQFHNCAYFQSTPDPVWIVDCVFDETVAPGAALMGTIPLVVDKNAALTELGLTFVDTPPSSNDSATKRWNKFRSSHLGTAKSQLSLRSIKKPRATDGDIDLSDNIGMETYHVKTSIDLAAKSASIEGSVGKAVTVPIGIVNNGPAVINESTLYPEEDGLTLVGYVVKVPSWAKADQVPDWCSGRNSPTGSDHGAKAGYPYYYCADYEDLVIGLGPFTLDFVFVIEKTSGDNGSVTVDTHNGAAKFDSDASNNVAPITLSASGQPSLPITGSKAGLIAGGGAVLVLLGGLMVLLGRRRQRAAAI